MEKATDKMKDISHCALIILYVIDEVIRENKLNGYFYYIESESSVDYVIKSSRMLDINTCEIEEGIFALDVSKLIYKFTCAKKFHVEDESICQMRINSWGREYIKQKQLLKKYEKEYAAFREFVRVYYKDNEKEYEELTENLLLTIDKNVAMKIKEINGKLKIKLLS